MNLSYQGDIAKVAEAFTETRQKNPAIAVNKSGDRVIVWGEAISHARGGRMNIRVVDASGSDTDFELDREIQIQDYSFPAAATLPNDDFLVLH